MASRRSSGSSRGKGSRATGSSAALFGTPTCPDGLDEVGKAKWTEIGDWLTAMGLIMKADRDMIGLYCAAFSRWYAAEAKVTQFGAVLMSKKGAPYRSPYLDVTIQASKEMQKLARALGLDPLSRQKLGIRITKPREVAKPDPSKEVPVPNPKPTTVADVRAMLQEQADAVRADPDLSTLEKARGIATLGGITLRAIETGEMAARIEAMEAILKTRKDEEATS